jgi:hypothetical protein
MNPSMKALRVLCAFAVSSDNLLVGTGSSTVRDSNNPLRIGVDARLGGSVRVSNTAHTSNVSNEMPETDP